MRQKLLSLVCATLLSACSINSGNNVHYVDASHIQPGQSVTVNAGDTVYGLAKKNKVDMGELIAVNRLQPPYQLKPGQQIYLPALGKVPARGSLQPDAAPSIAVESQALMPSAVEMQPLPPTKPMQALEWQTQPLKTPSQIKALEEDPLPPLVTEKVISSTVSPSPAINPNSDFRWPVEGPVISKFGAKDKGMNNDGMNIAAPRGAPVLASAGGTVVYSGNEMKGFGNLVLIRHEDNWVTAYAHLERMLVDKNAIVGAGDMIGTVGTSGGVSSPQLHYEIRHNGKAKNPETMLPKL